MGFSPCESETMTPRRTVRDRVGLVSLREDYESPAEETHGLKPMRLRRACETIHWVPAMETAGRIISACQYMRSFSIRLRNLGRSTGLTR